MLRVTVFPQEKAFVFALMDELETDTDLLITAYYVSEGLKDILQTTPEESPSFSLLSRQVSDLARNIELYRLRISATHEYLTREEEITLREEVI